MARVTEQAVVYIQNAHGLDRVEAFHLCQQRAKAVANIAARRREAANWGVERYGMGL